MSDFDKEAEREKLREKYERDQNDRETTERMSDLLLKGATMTNAHCGTCGDPIFRHEGQEFCPTCETVLREEGESAEADTGDAAADETDPGNAPQTTGRHSPTPNGADPTAADQSATAADTSAPETKESTANAATASETDAGTPTDADTQTAGSQSAQRTGSAASQSPATGSDTAGRTSAQPPTKPQDGSGQRPLDSAQASLTRTVNRLAAEAEASEDVERTQAYLAATEAAADALAAVKTADR